MFRPRAGGARSTEEYYGLVFSITLSPCPGRQRFCLNGKGSGEGNREPAWYAGELEGMFGMSLFIFLALTAVPWTFII
jgi:hypothetical protein